MQFFLYLLCCHLKQTDNGMNIYVTPLRNGISFMSHDEFNRGVHDSYAKHYMMTEIYEETLTEGVSAASESFAWCVFPYLWTYETFQYVKRVGVLIAHVLTCLCSLRGDTLRENDGCLVRVQDISRPSSSTSSRHTTTWWRQTGGARLENTLNSEL